MNSTLTDMRTSYAGVRALVFGASGFIGRSVVQALADCGALVFPVVRSQASASQVAEECPAACEIACCDVRNESSVRGLFASVNPAITFNLAGYGVDPAERDTEIAYGINANAPQLLCEAAHIYSDDEWPGQQFVHVGSALEYGTTSGDLNEQCAPQPTTLYGSSKLEGTLNVVEFAKSNKMHACTARLFMVYGPGELSHRLLPSLLRISRTGETLDLSTGLQRRDFTYIDDAAESLLRLGASDAPPGEIVNAATGKLTSIREFAGTAARILGISAEQLRFGALPQRHEEMSHEPVNIQRLQRLTSYVPSIGPAEGIRRTALLAHSGKRRVDESISC